MIKKSLNGSEHKLRYYVLAKGTYLISIPFKMALFDYSPHVLLKKLLSNSILTLCILV